MSGLVEPATDCRRCHGDGFPTCMCHVDPVVDFTVPPARDLDDLARVADELLATPLERLRAEVARYSMPGPLPLRFEAVARGAHVQIAAVGAWPCAETGAPIEVRFSTGVALDADAAAIARAIVTVTREAVEHERREHLRRDGVLVDDPHRRAP